MHNWLRCVLCDVHHWLRCILCDVHHWLRCILCDVHHWLRCVLCDVHHWLRCILCDVHHWLCWGFPPVTECPLAAPRRPPLLTAAPMWPSPHYLCHSNSGLHCCLSLAYFLLLVHLVMSLLFATMFYTKLFNNIT
jgi:hypothetical protein